MTLFLGVLATAFFDFHTPAVKNSTGLDDHLPIFGLDGYAKSPVIWIGIQSHRR